MGSACDHACDRRRDSFQIRCAKGFWGCPSDRKDRKSKSCTYRGWASRRTRGAGHRPVPNSRSQNQDYVLCDPRISSFRYSSTTQSLTRAFRTRLFALYTPIRSKSERCDRARMFCNKSEQLRRRSRSNLNRSTRRGSNFPWAIAAQFLERLLYLHRGSDCMRGVETSRLHLGTR